MPSLEQGISECSFGHHPECCFWGRFQFAQGNRKQSNNKICLSSFFLFALLKLLCSQFLTFLLVERDSISPCSCYLKWDKSPSPSPPGFHGCVCNYCFRAFCLAALEGNFKSFCSGGRNVKAAFFPALCTLCTFLCQSLTDITLPVICLVSCMEGGMLCLTTLSLSQTLMDQVKKKHLISVILEVLEYQWAGKIKANYKHSLWYHCVVDKEHVLGAALPQELHCPKSWQRSDCDHKNASVVSDSLLVPRHEPSAGVLLSADRFL